jgi:hypothetical protein
METLEIGGVGFSCAGGPWQMPMSALQALHLSKIPIFVLTIEDVLEWAPNLKCLCLQEVLSHNGSECQKLIGMLITHCPRVENLEFVKCGLLHEPLHELQKVRNLKRLWIDLSLLFDLEDEQNLLCRPRGQVSARPQELHVTSID